MKIGYTNDSYPEKRTILNNNPNQLIRLKSFNHYYIGAVQKRIPFLNKYSKTVFYESICHTNQVEGVHFFNSITSKDVPWISTYETCIPRLSHMSFLKGSGEPSQQRKELKEAEKYVKVLAEDNCKKIIALSKNNEQIQKNFLSFFPQYKTKILKKMVQLYPPQPQLVNRSFVEKKKNGTPIRFIFVGKFFNIKGGNEIVDVFYKIYQETNYPFELLLVSLEDMKNFVFKDFSDSEQYLNETKEKIKNCPSISLVSYIENTKLLDLLKEYDVGLLPTWADTFGYSVLEMQASGCPVITTNVRALDELNNENTGWKINLTLDQNKEVQIQSIEDKEMLRQSMQRQLEKVVLDILKNPEQIKQKSLQSYDHVMKQHSTEEYYKALNQIYEEAFQ